MVSTFVTGCGIATICFGILTFISFLGITIAKSFLQFYPDSEKVEKALKWNTRLNFIKNWSWQFMIYVFAFTSLCAGLLSIF